MRPYAICAGHELSARSAEEILKSGGNAIDAAIAAFATSWVTEPCMSGAGGGAFAVIRTANGKVSVFDFFCQTPKKKKLGKHVDFYPAEVNFGDATEVFHYGHASAAVPGSVAGSYAMHRAHGTVPMPVLLEQAAAYAREGVKLNAFQHLDLVLLRSIFGTSKRGREIFYKGDALKEIGDVIIMPGQAEFLDYLAREGEDAFYRGEIARRIASQCEESGGFLTMADLEDYKVIIREPLSFPFENHWVFTNPSPSLGGGLMAAFLGYFSHKKFEKFLSEEHLAQLFKACEKADTLKKEPSKIRSALHALYGITGRQLKQLPPHAGGTSHMSVVDKWGNVVCLTTSIGEGSAFFVEGTDIQMNNMLGEGALLPRGFHSWTPDVRLSSMMSPAIVTNHRGEFLYSLGSGGASRIPYMIAQVLINLVHFGIPLESAVTAPRVHLEHGRLNIEPGFPVYDDRPFPGVTTRYWSKQSLFFGGTHSLSCKNKRYMAIGDNRRDGVAIARN